MNQINQVSETTLQVLTAFLIVVIINQLVIIVLGIKKNIYLKQETDLLKQIEKKHGTDHPVYKKKGGRK